MRVFSLPLLALSYVTVTVATSIRIQIHPSQLLPNPNALPASTHATLKSSTTPHLSAVLRKDNTIFFPSIPNAGSYLLDIYSRDYTFAAYRIDVAPSSTDLDSLMITHAYETYRGTQWSDHGLPLTPNDEPVSDLTITAKTLTKKQFYEQRQGFNVLSLLKNPMILMGVVALAFTFGMPKMMENMDPDMKEEYLEMQKKSGGGVLSKMAQGGNAGGAAGDVGGFDLAGFLAGSQAKSSGASSGGGDIRERKR